MSRCECRTVRSRQRARTAASQTRAARRWAHWPRWAWPRATASARAPPRDGRPAAARRRNCHRRIAQRQTRPQTCIARQTQRRAPRSAIDQVSLTAPRHRRPSAQAPRQTTAQQAPPLREGSHEPVRQKRGRRQGRAAAMMAAQRALPPRCRRAQRQVLLASVRRPCGPACGHCRDVAAACPCGVAAAGARRGTPRFEPK